MSRQIEEFKPIEEGKVRFYHCGPTVYWVQHIGNMRAMVLADLIRRTFIYSGYDVKFVRNYTDVGHLISDGDVGEDKMEKGAKREGLTPDKIADKYIKIFNEDIKSLNTLPPTHTPRATEYVSQIIEMIQLLIDKGYAYVTPSAVYYDVAKFKGYNNLNRHISANEVEGAGAGEISDSNKRNPQDFVLWFFRTGPHKNAIQYWESPFESPEVENGAGFPGWHIECSVMSKALLGDTLDVHMGGVEHIPVHHTNEIAQSEAANGVKFVNYWMHYEHLSVDNGKMSKSIGNSYILTDVVKKGFDPMDLRYMYLLSHYRSKQNFTWKAMEAARSARSRMLSLISKLTLDSSTSDQKLDLGIDNLSTEAQIFREEFIKSVSDDFNIPSALSVAWNVLKDEKLTSQDKLLLLLNFDQILSVGISGTIDKTSKLDTSFITKVNSMLEERANYRQAKDWKKSDQFRDDLKNMGVLVEDGAEGTTWRVWS